MMIYSSDKNIFFTREYPKVHKAKRTFTIAALRIAQNKFDIDTKTDMNIAFFKSLTSESAFNHWTKNTERLEITENNTLRLTKKGFNIVNDSFQPEKGGSYTTDEISVREMIASMLNGSNFVDVSKGIIFEFTEKISKSDCYAKKVKLTTKNK